MRNFSAFLLLCFVILSFHAEAQSCVEKIVRDNICRLEAPKVEGAKYVWYKNNEIITNYTGNYIYDATEYGTSVYYQCVITDVRGQRSSCRSVCFIVKAEKQPQYLMLNTSNKTEEELRKIKKALDQMGIEYFDVVKNDGWQDPLRPRGYVAAPARTSKKE